VWLESGRSIIDLFGGGFILLAFADIDTAPVERAAKRRGVPLQTCRIRHAEAATVYERKLVLVRPDGHVAWRSNAVPEDCTALLATVCGAGLNAAARRLVTAEI
jgi:hypothetical protein